MSDGNKGPVHQELDALRLKADLQVSSHSYLRDYYLGWGQRLNLYTLLCSAILLLFTLTSTDFVERTLGLSADGYKWAIATAAFFTFCLSLIDLAWNPSSKSKAHDQAVGHYLRMNYEVRNLMIAGSGVNGEKLHLTITVTTASLVGNGHAFMITSTLNGRVAVWPGMVTD